MFFNTLFEFWVQLLRDVFLSQILLFRNVKKYTSYFLGAVSYIL